MHRTTPLDVEAYVRPPVDVAAVVSVLSSVIGPLTLDPDCPPDYKIYWHDKIVLIVQPSEDGFLNVWLRGSNAWRSCPNFARYLSKALGCQTRCDPGDEYPDVSPYSNTFLQIEDGNESLIAWG